MNHSTKFLLYKNKMSTTTSNIQAVKELRKLGWKVKQSELGELL